MSFPCALFVSLQLRHCHLMNRKPEDHIYGKADYRNTRQNIELLEELASGELKGIILWHKYPCIYICIKNNENMCVCVWEEYQTYNLQTSCCLKLDYRKWTNMQGVPITVRIISYKAWNSPVKYPSWEYKLHIKGSDGNMSRAETSLEVSNAEPNYLV